MVRMIIDTDPGIDDAMAIFFAHAHPDIELVGLTTVFGNVATELATANALRLVEMMGCDTPVCAGETAAFAGPPNPYPTWVHGEDGFGDIGVPAANISADPRHAVDFIADTVRANPGEITLVPVGPLTNIGRLVERHPDVVELVKEIVIMGGNVFHPGNVTPMAEANISNDPEAADLVCGAAWPLTLVGLDVTEKTTVTGPDFAEITSGSSAYGDFLAKASDYYIKFYTAHMGVEGCCMHDVAAVALPVLRDIFTLEKAYLRVETQGFSRGHTAAMPEKFYSDDKEWLDRPLQSYAAKIDSERMRRLFVDTLKSG